MRQLAKSMLLTASDSLAHIGVGIVPMRYYAPLADRLELKNRQGWRKPSGLRGVDLDVPRQVALLNELAPFFAEAGGIYDQATADGWGPGYGPIEAIVLHGVIRYLQPHRIIEVGAGVSTACMLHALKFNHGTPEYTIIEPYPSPALMSLKDVNLIRRQVQDLGVEPFSKLQAGDFLFIDSTHTVKPGSDVNFLILEVLPQLAPGVLVHFHDIFLPYDYQPDLFTSLYQWAETALLHAFLIGNPHARVELCLAQLHHVAPDAIKLVIPSYRPKCCKQGLFVESVGHFPSATYIATK